MDPRGRTAIITGAASGIGRACARTLAAAGATVVVADLDEAGGAETVELIERDGPTAWLERVDVSSVSDLTKFFRRVADERGPIEIVVNNAGLVSGEPVWPATSSDRIAAVVGVNVIGVLVGTKLAIDTMADRGGVVVNVSSTAALEPLPEDPVYAATKAAVLLFSRSCAGVAETHRVRVNTVLPGGVDTPIINKTGDGSRPAAWLLGDLERTPLLPPETIADAVLSLVLDDAAAGEAVVVDQVRSQP